MEAGLRMEDEQEPDVGSPQFDQAVITASQEVQEICKAEVFQVEGCPQDIVQAYLALYADGAAGDDIIEDRLGVSVLEKFKAFKAAARG